ncbi:hypothetical protein IJ847_01460 [Candidatus Saccharibacteria bacterium]|nr:hypothetical protein [Candidatus Saccharibacteria bacterium]
MKKAHKKAIAALAITAGLAGSATIVRCLPVSALENDATNDRPALSEEKKAEIKEKLDAMSEEERAEWLKNHPKKSTDQTEE